MKKFTVVLLIAVLAMTSVFANFDAKVTGTAEADYSYDIDEKVLDYSVSNSAVKATFTLEGAKAATAEAEGLRAEAAATLTWAAGTYYQTAKGLVSKTFNNGTQLGTFTLKLTKFVVAYKDVWSLDLTKAAAVGNFAKSAIDYETVSEVAYYYDNTSTFTFPTDGVTFTWNGFTFAGVAELNADGTDGVSAYLGAQTKSYALGDSGFSLQGAGAFSYVTDTWGFKGSLKAGYKSADGKMVFTASTDNVLTVNDGVTYDVDAAFNAKVYPATVDVYYAKSAKAKNTTVKNLLSAKATMDMKEDFGAPVVVSVAGLNVLGEVPVLSADATITFADGATLTAYANDLLAGKDKVDTQDAYHAEYAEFQTVGVEASVPFGVVTTGAGAYVGIGKEVLGGSVSAEYVNDWFTAAAEVAGEASYVGGDAELTVEASVTSTTVIKNATSKVAYESGNLLDGEVGTVTASLKVKF